ncbi:MAG: SPOR domain-containing protein [Bacteroidota bacterium]
MRLENYIKQLLYRHNCVILPGFGAFLAQRISAEIDEENGVLLPPKRIVSFNAQLKNEDGLLANYLAEVENLSYFEAQQKIALYIDDLLEALHAGESIELKDIGRLYISSDKQIQFNPSNHNFLLDAFGLPNVHIEQIKQSAELEFDKVSTSESLENTTEETEEKADFVLDSANQTQEKTTSPKPYLKYAAVGIIAIGLAGLGGFGWYNQQVEKHNLAAQQQAEEKIQHQLQEASFQPFSTSPTVEIKTNSKKDYSTAKYHIVAGAFRVEGNAATKVKQLQKLGFNARAIGKNKYGLEQVVYQSYTDKEAALKALKNIKKTHNSSAWLLAQ